MSLQAIIDSSASIEIIRDDVVAQTISRNGKISVARRDSVKPFVFKVTPGSSYNWYNWRFATRTLDTMRNLLEGVYSKGRYQEHTIQIGTTDTNLNWIFEYGPNQLTTTNLTTNISVNSTLSGGRTLRISQSSGTILPGAVMFKAGDLVQPVGHRYPYIVQGITTDGQTTTTTDVIKINSPGTSAESWNILVHRDIIGTITNGARLTVGPACSFNVIITQLPSYRFVNKNQVEFTGDFILMENIT